MATDTHDHLLAYPEHEHTADFPAGEAPGMLIVLGWGATATSAERGAQHIRAGLLGMGQPVPPVAHIAGSDLHHDLIPEIIRDLYALAEDIDLPPLTSAAPYPAVVDAHGPCPCPHHPGYGLAHGWLRGANALDRALEHARISQAMADEPFHD